ncbi:hypothetical protein STXM2123_1842 [Streptomyces sp. F-3]|nr:hypothetical protein STXM2123_1842 [Streptomyces sp. F-3]
MYSPFNISAAPLHRDSPSSAHRVRSPRDTGVHQPLCPTRRQFPCAATVFTTALPSSRPSPPLTPGQPASAPTRARPPRPRARRAGRADGLRPTTPSRRCDD